MEKEIKDPSSTKEAINPNGNTEEKSNDEKVKELVQKVSPYIKRLWQNRWRIVLINTVVAVIVVLYLLFLTKPYYESNVVILPEFGSKSTTLGGLSDLASLAGVNIGGGAPTEIYENLILSEAVLESVIYKKYQIEEFSKPVNLVEYFEFESDESLEARQTERYLFLKTYDKIVKSNIETNLDRLTKILKITVNMPESNLSANVANTLVLSLDNYIRTKRKSFASQQRFYIEKRIEQVKDSLHLVENELKNFREKNRIVEQSPNLLLEQNRMLRNVEIQQTVFIELTKQFEIAKIDEIKDTPIINIREEAKDSIIKAGPPRIKIFVILIFLSFIGTAAYFIFLPFIKHYLNLIKQK